MEIQLAILPKILTATVFLTQKTARELRDNKAHQETTEQQDRQELRGKLEYREQQGQQVLTVLLVLLDRSDHRGRWDPVEASIAGI